MYVLKVVDYERPYTGKDGNQHPSRNYYLVCDFGGNERRVAIKPAYEEAATALDLLARTEIKGNKSQSSKDDKQGK